jgi:hypothetical protein
MARKAARRRMGTAGGKSSGKTTRKSRAQDRQRQAELKEAKRVRRAARRKRKLIVRVASFGWRLGKGTAKGTAKRVAKYTPIAASAVKDKVVKTRAKQRFPDDYEPEPGEVPDEAWRVKTTYRCCNRRFGTPEALNAHHVREHAEDEAEKAGRPKPKLVISTTARSAGKRHVQPVAGTPTGRHRARKPGSTRADDLVAAHRATMTKIGEKAVMAENGAPLKISQAAKQLEEGTLGGLTSIENLHLGMEKALGELAGGYEAYRLKMIQAGFDPGHLNQLARIQADLEMAAKRSSSFIATLKDELADAIKAAQQRAAGDAPADKILTS